MCFEVIGDPVTYNDTPLVYCYDCLVYLLNHLWYKYIDDLKTDCEVSLKNLIEMGPPCYFRDPLINGGKEIKEFLYQGQIISGKLKRD